MERLEYADCPIKWVSSILDISILVVGWSIVLDNPNVFLNILRVIIIYTR